MRNMNGRMRRMAYKEQQRVAELEAKETERDAAKTPKERSEAEPQDADDKADPAP
jgi:hypothetical protein